ncbi:transposase family protein [Arthrobacter cavernae]|uniref:Transposase family protein n=1 Tax=Arthrobacter cavernae TaxID=2817681 RepID=A0A939HEF9_9MICC|nr:transposase family protein [Arthrobacter cavernae]
MRAAALDVAGDAHSVPDPGKRRGIRHRFTRIPVIAFCVTRQARSFASIAEWAKDAAETGLAEAGITVPHVVAIQRVLARMDAGVLDTAIGSGLWRLIAGVQGVELTADKNGHDGGDDWADWPTPNSPAHDPQLIGRQPGSRIPGARFTV